MAKRLDVGPKAVIDHLEMLESGLVSAIKSRDGENTPHCQENRLEIAVSPPMGPGHIFQKMLQRTPGL